MTESLVASSQVSRKPSMRALLKQADFRTLWMAQTVSWSGDHFTFLALMIVINQISGSASAIATMMLIMTIPRLLFGMAAGVFVDRWNRQRLMVVSDLTRCLLSLGLIVAATQERLWLLYPLAFLMSSVGVFFVPARSAVMKTIVPADDLLQANILMQTTYTITLVLGPALAGLTIGMFGTTPAFALDAVTFLVSASLVVTMSIPHLVRNRTVQGRAMAFWGEFAEGLAFVATSRTVIGLLIVLTVLSLGLGAVNALFVPLLMNILHVGAAELGIADSAQGLGMVAGGLLAAVIAARLRYNVIIGGGLILASFIIIAIGLAPTYTVVLLLLLVVGLVITPIEAAIPALMQRCVPLETMGRVGGMMNTSQSVATLLSMGVAAALADAVGPRLIFVGAGVIGVLAGILGILTLTDESHAE